VKPFFLLGIFEIGSLELFAQVGLGTMILLGISSSQVARIIGERHWHLAVLENFMS
jgi:hypothetical protein